METPHRSVRVCVRLAILTNLTIAVILTLLYSEIVIIQQMEDIVPESTSSTPGQSEQGQTPAADGSLSPGCPEQEQAPVTNGTSDHTTVESAVEPESATTTPTRRYPLRERHPPKRLIDEM